MSSFKHLLRAKSARIVVPVFLSVFIALAAGISFSCSFLEDDGFFDKIEGEVSVANADKMNVYIRYASIKFGKTTPADAALYQVKNNVSFSVTAVTNSEYAFYRWAAFSTKDFDVAKQHLNLVYNNDDDYYSNFGGKELDVSVVKFENSHEATTNVTVLQTRDDIWIMPIVAVRPTITSTRPNANQTPVRNTKLRVRFSKPMDSQSFEGNFVITQAIDLANGDAGDEEDITDKFEMDINEKGNQITFSFKETSEMFNANAIVSIYFNDDISDNTGYKLANSQTLQWLIGKNIDNLPPIINEMTAGIGNDCQKFASTPTREAKKATSDLSNKLYTDELLTHRIKDKVNLYVYAGDIAKIDDKLEEGDVSGLGVRARSLIDLEGNAIESSKEGNFIADEIIPYLAAENNPNYSEISGDFKSITGKNVGTLYTYDLSSLPDGLIQIEVYAYDGNENNGDTGYDPSIDDEEGVGNGPRSIFVVKDNKAPAIENEVDKIKSSSIAAPYGWYNKLTIDTVEIYDTAANPIRDFGHQKLGAAHENLKWVCNIGTSTDWQVPANDARWVPVSERYKIGSASIDNDGAVSVTIRLMDDLGNISEAKHITSVLCDNTVPDAGNMFCVDASGNQCLNSTKETVVPDSMLIRLPFTEELSGVKVVGLNIKASDGTKVENAFENASILYSAEGAPSAAEPVAIEPDTSSLKALLDSEGYAKTPIFTDGLDCLHVLGASYHTGIFYIKNLTLGDADGMYTVTITLYDAALNKAAEKSVMLAHDTKSPVVDRVVIQNVVPRKVYNENETTYWLPRSAYDDKKDAKYVSVSVTATENGSGVKVVTIGENAHITGDTAFFIEGTPVAEGRCSIDPKTNTVVFSDYNNPDIYKQTGSVSFVLTNIRLDNPNSADGNKVSVSLKDFVDNSGINENAGNFDLYIDDTSDTKIYKVFSDSMAPGIDAKTPPALADGKADSASDETKYSAARLALEYTDTKNVDLSLTLSAQATGSGVRSLALTNGLFTADTNISVDGKPLAITEYTLDGPIVTFVNSVFTAENTLKFTNVELQGAEDGPQSISITATNFTGWVSNASATKTIVLDRAAPVVDDVRWNLKEGVYGVSKAAVVSNMDLCVTFTEVMTGVKVLGIDPKLNNVSATETPFDSTKFAIKYLSQSEAEAQTPASTEEAEEGKEVKPIEKDPLALIGSAKLLKADEDYTITGNYITFKNPQNFKSGLFVLENLKAADNFEDNKSYKINVHLSDAALNGTAKDGQADLASDSTAPQIKRIFINRLIARTQAGAQDVDSWWISKEDFEQAGKVPTKIDVELTINESGSGVETVVLGENLRLTKNSVITCGTTTLAKDKDYKVSSDFATITLITKSSPKFRDENNDFTVKISNATLTSEGENKVSVTLKDFALNSDENSKLSEIALPESGKEPVESVFVDFTAPLLAEGGVKIVDRGGSPELDGTADKDANTVALDGFTNEKLVNITVKTASSEDGIAKRSGVKQLVLSGAKYSSSSKFYYKDTASDSEDFAEIMNVDTGDGVTATFKNSYACENVCEFIITNVELTGAEGENTVSVYPVDLVGWSDSEKAVNDKITLDMTPPNWGNNAVVMGTIGENGNDADYVWPKTPGARILASDGEVYFYKRPQGTESEPIYLTVNASDTNFYGLYFVSEASDKSSGVVAIAAKQANQTILTKITDVKFDASSNHEYTIVLKDRAGNISTETKSVHVVKDGEAEIVNDDDESSSLQNNMEYKESRENYHIFKTSVPKTLTREESEGVDEVSGVSGYAVYYNDGNGGKDGVNPVTIEVNLANHKEKNFTINSGVAYYAINGSAQAPAAVLEGEYSAPISALQNWNKWIPFTSGTTKLTLYPKNDGKNPLNMRLWFKDNVGNVKSVEIKQKTEDGILQAKPDIWICDNTIPQNANGTTDGFVPENNQLSSESTGFAFEKMMPDHAWFDGTTLKFMNTSSTALKTGEDGKTANTIYYTALSKLTLVINNEPSETVAIESGEADSENWAVKLFLYPSNSATTPSREVVMSWIKEEANKNKYFYGIPSGSTITLSNIEYPKECSETTPYIYVVAEDRVGNINISKLNVKVTAPSYNSTSNSTYWYGKFVYSATEEAPQIWLGGTGVHGNKTYVDVNADTFSSAEDIAKLVPYNAGRRPYVDATAGKTWISSNTYSLTANSLAGYNTKHDYSDTKNRLFFYVDVDTEIPYAYYYSHSATPNSVSLLNSSHQVIDSIYSSNSSSWLILDTTSTTYNIDGKVPIPTVIGDNSYMTSSTLPTYLHVADKLGRVKSVRLGNTKYQHDNTSPTVNFTGLAANDKKALYRLDYQGNKLAVTFANDAKTIVHNGGSIKVYIPTLHAPGTTGSYVSDSYSGLYGYSWLDHLEEDTAEICRDEENSDCGFYPTIDTNNANGYYLVFDNETANAKGSLSIDDEHPQTFYAFDKVGNRTAVSILSSIDDKPPELTMSFGAYSDKGFTGGRIYDASTTNTTKVINCDTANRLPSQTFIGSDSENTPKPDDIGYTVNKPYVIYSNALGTATGTTGFGYVLGTFVAKDQKGTDTTGYNGILTEIVVKRYVLNGSDTGTSADWNQISAITLPYALNPIGSQEQLVQDENKAYTLPMPIFLDGEDDAHPVASGANFKGKLYQIVVKDSGGNATTIYLKVMRDRTGPKFKCGDGYVGQDSSHRAVVQGGVGYYSGKVFYQSSGTTGYINPAYIKLPKAVDYSDGTTAIGAAYDEDCGVFEKDNNNGIKDLLKRVTGTSDFYTSPVSSDEAGYVMYKLEGNGSSACSFCLYAVDILGNEATYKLSVENNDIPASDKVYCIDNTKPTVSAFEMTTSSYGKFASDTIHFNYNESAGRFNGYEKISGKFDGFKIKVTTSDTNKTTETSVAKYCFISTSSGITTVPTDWTGYTKKDATSTPNEFTFTIVPKDYYAGLAAPDSDPRYIYFYAVDYAGNLSLAKKLTIKINDDRPSISGSDTSVGNYVISEDGRVYYFNKNTTVSTKLTAIGTSDPIRWYGVYDNWANAVKGYSIAATEVDKGASSTYTGGTITFSFADYGKTSDGKLHAENSGAISQFTGSGSLFIETWSVGNVPSKEYYLPFGTEATWTYDATVDPPSNVGVPEPATGASKVAWHTHDDVTNADTVYYSKTLTTVDVKLDFPADVAGIKGYKISILSTSASAPSPTAIACLTVNEFTGTNAIAPGDGSSFVTKTIPVDANSSTDNADKKVYIYAVDGLGNVSAPYTFTISKLSNAQDVTGISIDRANISVAGSGAEFVVNDQHTIYVNGSATSVTIKPVISDDITGTTGFALSEDGLDFTDIVSSVTDADNKTFTITFGAELPSGANGSKEYKVYAKNGIGLYSATGYALTVIRDITGPSVSKITLERPDGGSANLIGEKLYYNNVEIKISSVTAADPAVSSGVDGVGKGRSPSDSTERYSLVINAETGYEPTDANREFITNHDYVEGAAQFTLGLLTLTDGLSSYSKSTNGICIAAFDKLGNIKLTPLSAVEITVGTDVDKTISNFIYDNVAPQAPASVAFSHATASVNNGWYVKNETESSLDLYYNIANINVTPSQGTSADANFLGFKVGTDGAVANDMTLTLSTGDAEIYTVDKAGNVSATAFVIHMIQDNTVAAPALTTDSQINEASSGVAFWSSGESKVYYKEGSTSVKLNVDFASDDVTGIKGYKTKVGSGEISGLVTASGGTNAIEITVPETLSADNEFTAKIYAVDNVGNINGEGEALTVTFKKLTNAADVTGIGETIETTGEGGTFKRGADSADGAAVIYVNGFVATVTVTPTFTTTDVTGINGFATASNGTVSTSNETFTLDVDTTKESKTYEIYAVNNVGLYSAAAYKVTIIRDTTGPVVSEITLTKPEGAGLNYVSAEKKLYYNNSNVYISSVTESDAGAGSADSKVYAVTVSEEGDATTAAGTALAIGKHTSDSNAVYIAAKDCLGNVSHTPLNKVKVTIAGTDPAKVIDAVDGAASFTFAFDDDKPAVPASIALTPDSEGNTKAGNGVYLGEATADAEGKYSSTIYYNTTLLGVDEVSLTPRQTTANADLAGFFVGYETTNTSYTALSDKVTVDLSKSTARIYAVDKAGNISSRYKITLVEDTAAAKTFNQVVAADNNSIKLCYDSAVGSNYVSTYYNSSDYALKLKLEANKTSIIGYAFTTGSTTSAPTASDAWTSIEVKASDGQKEINIPIGEITTMHTTCHLWVKDEVGNIQAYKNPTITGENTYSNELGNPTSNENLRYTWWHYYKQPESLPLTYTINGNILKIEGFSENFPVKSLKFENFVIIESGTKIKKISGSNSDETAQYQPFDITPSGTDVSKSNNSYTLEFNKNQIVKDLEITFDKGGLYFPTGAKVTVSSEFNGSLECNLTASADNVVPTCTISDKTLTIEGLWSSYPMRYFSFLNGISFGTDESQKMASVKIYKDGAETVVVNTPTGSLQALSETNSKYIISFGNTDRYADKIIIEFESVPTLSGDVKIELAQYNYETDKLEFPLSIVEPASDPEPDTSIFGGFFDRVSSGITSIFSGRSMTHEELEALKEAKAEKARARAAEKAAKKAAKKAARDAKKNAEIASASPNQGESWTGLSGEFESASSELDSALAKIKDSSGPEAKASDEVSSKKGIIKVKSGKKNAVSNSKELITDSTVRKTENHDNRMIYVFGFLAVLGVISGIFAKKVRKNSKKS